MQSTTTYSRGDVVFVPFRFTQEDRKSKNRPAVVVSSASYHDSRKDVIIAGITSNVSRQSFVGHVVLRDWHEIGLAKPSAISGIIMTVRNSVIGRRIGRLSNVDSAILNTALRDALDLP